MSRALKGEQAFLGFRKSGRALQVEKSMGQGTQRGVSSGTPVRPSEGRQERRAGVGDFQAS